MAILDGTLGSSNVAGFESKAYTLSNEIDLANPANASTAVAAVTGDVIQSISIPAGTYVTNVHVEIVDASAAATSYVATVGDGGGTSAWDASTNLAAAAGTFTQGIGGTDANVTAGGKMYAAADTIDLTLAITGAVSVSGKYRITALCYQL